MKFLRDLASGSKAEGIIQAIFLQHGYNSKPNLVKKQLSDFDIEVELPNKNITIESKFDLYCARSGNIAIEFYNPKQGKPSGIGSTKADIWVHIITDPMSVWFTSVKKLKGFIETTKPLRTVSCGGDNNSSMHLYKKDIIFDAIFHRVDDCDIEDFKSVMNTLLEGDIC